MGFGAPVHEWLQLDDLVGMKEEYLGNKNKKIHSHLDYKKTKQFVTTKKSLGQKKYMWLGLHSQIFRGSVGRIFFLFFYIFFIFDFADFYKSTVNGQIQGLLLK